MKGFCSSAGPTPQLRQNELELWKMKRMRYVKMRLIHQGSRSSKSSLESFFLRKIDLGKAMDKSFNMGHFLVCCLPSPSLQMMNIKLFVSLRGSSLTNRLWAQCSSKNAVFLSSSMALHTSLMISSRWTFFYSFLGIPHRKYFQFM